MAAPVAVVDVLNSLLEAHLNSVFRFLEEGSPYLSRAAAEVRRPLLDMVLTNERQGVELANMIEQLGGFPAPRSLQAEEQYMAFLSVKFLLPKLADATRLMIERYENALTALGSGPRDVVALLQSHLAAQRQQLEFLDNAVQALMK